MARDRLSDSIRVVVIESDPGTRETIKQHAAAAGYELAKESGDANDCERIVAEARPDLVFLTVGDDPAVTLERIRRIREHHGSTAIVLVSDEASPQLILSAMRAGAHEFLTRPLDAGELEGALSRLERQWGPAAASRSGGRIWATYATKGGVGGSSLATNLALALQKHLKTRTALVDFNMQVGDLALMLDATGGHSFAHAVGDGDIDQVKLRTMLSPHSSGLSLLTMADRPEESNLVKRRHVSTLLTLLREMFEYVIVDLGRHIDERSIELLDHSDLIVLVTALDVPTIRNTSSYLDLLRRLEVPTERVRLVVNRLEEGRRITNRDLTRAVGQDIFFAIPNDYTVMSAAIDSGSPVVVNAPRSKLAESYAGLARALAASCSRSRSMSETESREVS